MPVAEPLGTALRIGPPAPAAEVAAAIAGTLRAEEAPDAPPAWLRAEQVTPFRRALAALARFGGAMLALPVGRGKTYIALAVAARVSRGRPTVCVVPASLRGQWRNAAARVGVPVVVVSHEAIGRGRLPPRHAGLVIVDESHRFRNPGTRRYRVLAPWLVGRPVILLTATPVVNRVDDLARQLHLAIRDRALGLDGLPSLLDLCDGRSDALDAVVVVGSGNASALPARIARPIEVAEGPALVKLLEAVDGLRLSSAAPIAALVRSVLWRACASSPAAVAAAARRYLHLLLHARDALAAGRTPGRHELRRLTGPGDDQLVWWELLDPGSSATELDPADIDRVRRLVALADAAARQPDPKLDALRALLHDARRTVTFTTATATVRYLRDRLGGSRIAWCTGNEAGIGHARLPREAVLHHFRPGGTDAAAANWAPTVLIASDVAAEGLDLQLAERVVHYDLPWTPMRLEQREGRALRLGSPHAAVDVVRFSVPESIERRLRQCAVLAAKTELWVPRSWSWRAEIARWFAGRGSTAGVARVTGDDAGVLAGFVLEARDGHGRTVGVSGDVGWVDEDGRWRDDPPWIVAKLRAVAAAPDDGAPTAEEIREAIDRIARPLRERAALARERRWRAAPGPTRALLERLYRLAAAAARRRDERQLARLHRAIRLVAGGQTAGELLRTLALADRGDREMVDGLERLPPPDPVWETIEVRLIGLVIVRAPGAGG